MTNTKKTKKRASEDEIRFGILKSLHQLHRVAGTATGSHLGIQALKSRVRPLGFKAAQIQRNVSYLADNSWIRAERELSTGRGGQTFPGKQTYRISSKGVDLFEGRSFFQEQGSFYGIDIVNVQGIVQIGHANYASANFQELQATLEDLRPALLSNESIGLDEKVQYLSDILAIQAQLLKDNPDSGLLRRAKSRFSVLKSRLRTLGGAASLGMLLEKVVELLGSIP